MILLTVIDDNPMLGSGICCKLASTPIITTVSPPNELDFCYCGYECDYTEYAFVNENSDTAKEDYENDKSTMFVVNNDTDNGSVSFFINDGDSDYSMTDDTYGEYFEFNTVTDHENQAWYIVDWLKVYQVLGLGTYTLKYASNSFGSDIEEETHYYRVLFYDVELADRTIKIESINNGAIMIGDNPIDYTGLNLYRSYRIRGDFGRKQYDTEVETYVVPSVDGSTRNYKQIQDKAARSYTLNLYGVPSFITNVVHEDMLLGNEIYLSDYNILNTEFYMSKRTVLGDRGELEYTPQYRRSNQEITMNDYDLGPIKRNV